ncbi:ankyrin repeat-containing domain protein [Aspergillus granulosus]|uniref:Ankyrin repeat-containing domain protein n=1 Tax=Aspergillus granulosus TaxID=176169 RepID=A0ABR4GS56_9EURO
MACLLVLPAEIIIQISWHLTSKYAVAFSRANRYLYELLEYTRREVPHDPRILATAVENRRDPAAIKYLFGLITPVVGFPKMLGALSVAFKGQNTEALQVLCGEDCFNIYQGNTRQRCAGVFFDAMLRGHELALKHFIKLWPDSLGSALVGAAAGGSVAIARCLIENGADVNATGPGDTFDNSWEWFEAWKDEVLVHGRELQLTPLASAAAKGHLEMVQLLVQHGAMIEVQDQSGDTPLCWAARKGKCEVINYILSMCPAEDIQDLALQALRAAGNRDQNESIILLWNYLTPKPEPRPDNTRWLLRAATMCQDTMLLSQLFENGFGNMYQTHPPLLDNSAISAAIEKHDIDIFKLLLQRLAYGDQTLPDLLVRAIKGNDEDIVSYLLGRVDVAQLPPMILVHAAPYEPIFKKLASAGVDQAELRPRTENWILGGLVHVLDTLLSDPGFRLEEHIRQPILDCAIYGGKQMFEFLFERHQWDDAEMAIPTAVMAGHLDLLEALIKRGFPFASEHDLLLIAARNVKHSSALSQIIDFLLERNPRALCELNSDGQTILFRLIASDRHGTRTDAVRLLLDRGANPLQKNLIRNTPLGEAARNGYQSRNTPLGEAARNGYQHKSFGLMREYLQRRGDWHVIGRIVVQLDKVFKENFDQLIQDISQNRSPVLRD